jgi:hypothetical protein
MAKIKQHDKNDTEVQHLMPLSIFRAWLNPGPFLPDGSETREMISKSSSGRYWQESMKRLGKNWLPKFSLVFGYV